MKRVPSVNEMRAYRERWGEKLFARWLLALDLDEKEVGFWITYLREEPN